MKNTLHYWGIVLTLMTTVLITSCDGNRQNNQDKSVEEQADKDANIVSRTITYKVDDENFTGYLFHDSSLSEFRRPGIIVVHEWWGNNEYSQMRAKMLAEIGYVAFAADMYGSGLTVDTPEKAQENAAKVYADPEIIRKRMAAAFEVVNNNRNVSANNVGAIGYCFGGSVCLTAAAMGVPVDAVVSFHGGLEGFTASDAMKDMHTLVCNGAADPLVTDADIENFKDQMNKVNAPFEFNEYDGALHAFTNPAATAMGVKYNMPIAYNKEADEKSWNDMVKFLEKHLPLDKAAYSNEE